MTPPPVVGSEVTVPARTTVSPRRPVPAPERPRHLEVVRGRPTPGRRPPTLFVLLCVLATCAGLFALVMANVLLGQAGFTHAELEDKIASKRSAIEQLQLDVAALTAPSRISERALELGMVPASDVTVVAPAERTPSPDRGPSPKRGRP